MKEWSLILRNMSLLTQLGLSLVMPLLICLFICSWLSSHFSIGSWIYIPGFFFGLGGSGVTALKLYRSILKKENKKKKKDRNETAFNDHL